MGKIVRLRTGKRKAKTTAAAKKKTNVRSRKKKSDQQKAIGGMNAMVVKLAFADGKAGQKLKTSRTYYKKAAAKLF